MAGSRGTWVLLVVSPLDVEGHESALHEREVDRVSVDHDRRRPTPGVLADGWGVRGRRDAFGVDDGAEAQLDRGPGSHQAPERLDDDVVLGRQIFLSLPDELSALTAEKIQEVAASVFDRRKMTVGVLQSPAKEELE